MKIEKLIEAIFKEALKDYSSMEIRELQNEYTDEEESVGDFFDRFELGNWLYYQLQSSNLELSDLLSEEYESARTAEKEANEEYWKIEQIRQSE